jgi:threonyl-tRNA synthetase
VGEKESENNLLSVRKQGENDLGEMSIQDFAQKIQSEVAHLLA